MTSTNMIPEMPLTREEEVILYSANSIKHRQKEFKTDAVATVLAGLCQAGCRVKVLIPGYDYSMDEYIGPITRDGNGKFVIAPNTRYDESDVDSIESDPARDPIITIVIN